MVHRSRCLMAGQEAGRGPPSTCGGRSGSERQRLLALGLAQGTAHSRRIAEEGATSLGRFLREGPSVAKGSGVAGLPLAPESHSANAGLGKSILYGAS